MVFSLDNQKSNLYCQYALLFVVYWNIKSTKTNIKLQLSQMSADNFPLQIPVCTIQNSICYAVIQSNLWRSETQDQEANKHVTTVITITKECRQFFRQRNLCALSKIQLINGGHAIQFLAYWKAKMQTQSHYRHTVTNECRQFFAEILVCILQSAMHNQKST